jgi:hypothetical protein
VGFYLFISKWGTPTSLQSSAAAVERDFLDSARFKHLKSISARLSWLLYSPGETGETGKRAKSHFFSSLITFPVYPGCGHNVSFAVVSANIRETERICFIDRNYDQR